MNLKKAFFHIFKENPYHLYFSPGRVNLIGEHIDYNGGLVFPAAINLGTYAALTIRKDNTYNVYSKNFSDKGIIEFSSNNLTYNESHHYANYIKGVIDLIKRKHQLIDHGFNLYIEGTLPPRSGLSSSASLLVLIVFIFNDLYKLGLSRTEIALYAQEVENHYMGMHCGIMDQLIIANGTKDKALLMDTKTYQMIPVNAFFKGFTWVIMNTNYKRKTTDSKYNERVFECQKAFVQIKNYKDIKYLCDLSIDDLDAVQKQLDDDQLFKRVKHVVTEKKRVLTSKEALKNQNAKLFGKLLNESHESLKVDYEVTGFHLDALVEGALINNATGARVTGAGFGGCAIALVPNTYLSDFETKTKAYYKQKTKLDASFYQVDFVDGVHKIETIDDLISSFLTYGIDKHIVIDFERSKQNLISLFKLNSYTYTYKNQDISFVLDKLLDYGFMHKLFSPNTSMERDQFEALLFDQMMPTPLETKHEFKKLFAKDKELAIKYLHQLSVHVNYIKEKRNAQNINWIYHGTYGNLEMTINLSKPEKDPKDIAKALNMKKSYTANEPQCVLCKENEHHYENARMNLRIVPFMLNHETWHFQYSPYAYFNEHAIILSDVHRDMNISCDTFKYLLDFVDHLPSYFIGSNADLPIVGGSILNHDHFQAGRYVFPIEHASALKTWHDFSNLTISHLNWPLSTIKCVSKDRMLLSKFACHILKSWQTYSNPKLDIIASSYAPHQTITPILRKDHDVYHLYLILRNNRVSKAYPDGIFHPHQEVFHIKKENIGLIEAMGLAILPGRLKTELMLGLEYIKHGTYHLDLEKHKSWLDFLKKSKNIASMDDLYHEVGLKFETVLTHAGVFKLSEPGIHAMHQFINEMMHTYKKM